jgi:hypothetical protein
VSARVHQQVRQLEQLLDLVDLEPAVRARLQVALRAVEAEPPAAAGDGVRVGRMVEAITPAERALVLGMRHADDPDAFLAAWQARSPAGSP